MENIVNDVYIILDDFNTTDYNIKILELGAKQPSSLKYEKSEAYGQEGYTKVSEDAYRGFERTSIIMISSDKDYDLFMNEFYIGKDVKVYYSDDKNRHRYGTISELEDNVIIGENREIVLTVDLQPFLYSDDTKLVLTEQTDVFNQGNIYALPVITVYGTGKGRIYLGDSTMEVDVDEELIVDSREIDVYDKFGLRANSRRLSGDFFRLKEGKNTVHFDGLITKLEVNVNWRWR